MIARRFQLDKAGNLHALGLFCRPLEVDPDVGSAAQEWSLGHIRDARTAKANAKVGFEQAWAAGKIQQAYDLSREVHILMLAQRLMKERSKMTQ